MLAMFCMDMYEKQQTVRISIRKTQTSIITIRIKIVFIDRNDPDFMQDYMDGKYDDADVTVPKTNA